MQKSQLSLLTGTVATLTCIGSSVGHAAINTYSSRSDFNTAIAVPVSVEDFTPDYHFPITTGILNTFTSLTVQSGPAITPGMILPGVTYSTPIASGYFFNIDAGGGFVGGFLDTIVRNGPVTVTFDEPANGFGFDANSLMGNFNVTIHRNDDPDASFNYPTAVAWGTGLDFFGFVSSSADITSITILGDDSTFGFAFDNFTFPTPIPEPTLGALLLLPFTLKGIWILRTRSRKILAGEY
jgi:hypothetical protein